MGKKNDGTKTVCENRKARHDYFILEAMEAGIELFGTEVKSLRAGKANLKDSYAVFKNGEIFLEKFHISPYEQGNIFNRDPLRPKKLLLHKAQIIRLFSRVGEKGLTVIPLKIYFKEGRAKAEIALCAGKHNYDKRAALAEKDAKREMERAVKNRYTL